MRRGSLGFQQQCYDDEGMWMESQLAQQQQSHGFHEEESWSTDNNKYHHKQQFPGMLQHMKPGGANYAMDSELSKSKHHHGRLAGGDYGMFQESSMPGGYGHGFGHNMQGGSGRKYPYGGGTTTNAPHHYYPNGGGGASPRFNHGGHHDYVSEEYEYEAYKEEHVGAASAKIDEKRYENHNWGGDVRYANPYGYGGYKNMNMNMKPHGHGGHKVEWTVKGV